MSKLLQNKFAWSYSVIENYENCPRNYNEVRRLKRYPYTPSSAAKRGTDIHEAMELGVKLGKEIPKSIDHRYPDKLQTFVSALLAMRRKGYEVGVETQIALTRKLHPTGWFDADVWLRVIIDSWVYLPKRKQLVVYDYKTGTPRFSSQLGLTAAAAAFYFVDRFSIDSVLCEYLYIDHLPDQETKDYYKQKGRNPPLFKSFPVYVEAKMFKFQIASFKQSLISLDQSITNNDWPEHKCFLCRMCPIKDCEYNPN